MFLKSKIKKNVMNTPALIFHQEKLDFCSREWLIYRKIYVGVYKKKDDWMVTQNHCNNRDCPSCLSHRIGSIKQKLNKKIRGIRNVCLVTLTFGKHRKLTKKNIQFCIKKHYNFIRKLNRKQKRYVVFSVLEAKKEPDGLFHFHIHDVFCGYCPHHLKVTKEWEKTLGYHADTDVKYRHQKALAIWYLAKRSAECGMDKTPEEYLKYIQGTRVFRILNACHLEYMVINLPTTDEFEDEFYLIFIGTLPKSRMDKDPPPEETLWALETSKY